MNLRSLWSTLRDKPTSDALDYITKRINLVWTREHDGDTGTHVFPVGVWTPTIGGTGGASGQTYAGQAGFFLKAGQFVHVTCRVQLSALGTITGAVQIQGLPFPTRNASGYRVTAPVIWANTATTYVTMVAVLNPNASVIDLVAAVGATNNLAAASIAQANLTNTTLFVVSLAYETGV